jgi:hypothetical protein
VHRNAKISNAPTPKDYATLSSVPGFISVFYNGLSGVNGQPERIDDLD